MKDTLKETHDRRVDLRLSSRLLRRLDNFCQENLHTRSSAIRELLDNNLRGHATDDKEQENDNHDQ